MACYRDIILNNRDLLSGNLTWPAWTSPLDDRSLAHRLTFPSTVPAAQSAEKHPAAGSISAWVQRIQL